MDAFFIVLAASLAIPFLVGCVAGSIAMWAEIMDMLTHEPEDGDE